MARSSLTGFAKLRLTRAATRANCPARSTPPPTSWPTPSPRGTRGSRRRSDWDATLKFRHHLWGLGLKIAEAMDTSQRGMGLDWSGAKELIKRSLLEAKTVPGADLACGAGTDHLNPADVRSLDDVVAAYEEQLAHIEAYGGRAILMASRALCKVARSKDDYLYVYDRIIRQASDKVILHWLGEMFDPQLSGYWASREVDTAMANCLELINAHPGKVEGIKISLLERSYEEKMRALLPDGVKMYTGDDFNYADLIEGDGTHHSHALLGIFDPIAPAAAAAMDCLAKGDGAGYHAILDPTVPLSAASSRRRPSTTRRGRVPRLAERLPGSFPDGRRHGVGPGHPALLRDLPAGRPGPPPRRPRPRDHADAPVQCPERHLASQWTSGMRRHA